MAKCRATAGKVQSYTFVHVDDRRNHKAVWLPPENVNSFSTGRLPRRGTPAERAVTPKQCLVREKDRQRPRLRLTAKRAALTVFFEEENFPQNWASTQMPLWGMMGTNLGFLGDVGV
ncbi:uncharacterized protein LOC117153935 isoform X2 [Bombus vancouverensis nearcticus]|uniref:uncharacterized protein LOC117153935 isoform X2 n=1 Tax=Bombus vancouverensis nearcticus TaxID=2705178 RepID=UPI00402B8619